MKRYYYEVWCSGYVNARSESDAKAKLKSSTVAQLYNLEDADVDITIEEDDE